ncbi:MAG: T9SS type A sorting domain-containing protein [Bacteroidetes bacterium]|nr:T9SS type A sorting domain-containing protein [Bacteroidota bacterium]
MKTNLILLFILFILGHTAQKSFASHAMGGEIRYECNGGNQYTIYLQLFRDCSGINLADSQTIVITNSCGFSSPASMIVNLVGNPHPYSSICDPGPNTCFGGSFFGFARYDFSGTVTLPGACSDWTFSNTVVNRNASITTTAGGANDSMYIYSMFNNLNSICDTAPLFYSSAASLFYTGMQSCYDHGVYDPEGDSLSFQLTTPRTGPSIADTVHYLSGYSYTSPISSSSTVTFDSSSGRLCFNGTQVENSIFAVIVSEYRNGVLIGQVERDIQLRLIQDPIVNVAPTLSGIDGSAIFNIAACPVVPVDFFVASYDSNATEDLFIYWDQSIPSATWTYDQLAITNIDTAYFSWTPSLSDVSTTPHCFTISSHDDHCGFTGNVSHQFCITVYPLSDPFCINPGIQEKDNALNFQLYPNPAHDELNLLFEEQDPQATFLAIYNSTGQNVYSEMISSFENINVSSWPRGLYTIVINVGNKVTSKRVVIQ